MSAVAYNYKVDYLFPAGLAMRAVCFINRQDDLGTDV